MVLFMFAYWKITLPVSYALESLRFSSNRLSSLIHSELVTCSLLFSFAAQDWSTENIKLLNSLDCVRVYIRVLFHFRLVDVYFSSRSIQLVEYDAISGAYTHWQRKKTHLFDWTEWLFPVFVFNLACCLNLSVELLTCMFVRSFARSYVYVQKE